MDWGGGLVHFVDAKNRPTTTESFIGTSKKHISDPQLTKSTSTHNAWFDSDIQIRVFENFCIVRFEDFIDCTKLSVSDSLTRINSALTRGAILMTLEHTDRVLLVSFMPLPMILLEWTKTQPTGVSPLLRAVRA
jgi:hypothetical protein